MMKTIELLQAADAGFWKPSEGFTQSLIKDFLACRYRFLLKCNGISSRSEKRSLRFGSLMHTCLEARNKIIVRKGGKVTIAVLDKATKRVLDSIVDGLVDASSSPQEADRILEEGAWATALLRGYLAEWHETDTSREWVSVERNFDVWWLASEEPDAYRLRGKRDGLFRGGGRRPRLWLHETKTSSRIVEEQLTERLAFDFQSLFYLLACEIEFAPAKIGGVQFDYIRTPSLRQKKKESRPEFVDRVVSDIELNPDHYFKRWEATFPKEMKVRFLIDLKCKLEEMILWYQGTLPTYRSEGSCFGAYQCAFTGHCASDDFVGYEQGRGVFPELDENYPIVEEVIEDACGTRQAKKKGSKKSRAKKARSGRSDAGASR